MPELPEAEVMRRAVERWALGCVVSAVEVGDPSVVVAGDPGEVAGRRLSGVVRRGKQVVLEFEEVSVLVQLRMTGKLIRVTGQEVRARRVAWRFESGVVVGLVDRRRLGQVEVLATDAVASRYAELGPEPWPEALSGEALREALRGARGSVKAALLEPRRAGGVGNIVACEALWRARIAPTRQAEGLSLEACGALGEGLWAACAAVIEAESGSDEIQFVSEGGDAEVFAVYGREGRPCRRCEASIVRVVVSGRGTWLCPVCQAGEGV